MIVDADLGNRVVVADVHGRVEGSTDQHGVARPTLRAELATP